MAPLQHACSPNHPHPRPGPTSCLHSAYKPPLPEQYHVLTPPPKAANGAAAKSSSSKSRSRSGPGERPLWRMARCVPLIPSSGSLRRGQRPTAKPAAAAAAARRQLSTRGSTAAAVVQHSTIPGSGAATAAAEAGASLLARGLTASAGSAATAAAAAEAAAAGAASAGAEVDPSFLEDVALVEAADVVLGLHGSGLYNAMFMKRRHSSIVEVGRGRGGCRGEGGDAGG